MGSVALGPSPLAQPCLLRTLLSETFFTVKPTAGCDANLLRYMHGVHRAVVGAHSGVQPLLDTSGVAAGAAVSLLNQLSQKYSQYCWKFHVTRDTTTLNPKAGAGVQR